MLGDSLFFEVLRDYVATFGGGNVDTEDLINVINDHYSGPNVHWFFDQWVYGMGLPVIMVDLQPDPGEAVLRVSVSQLQTTSGYFSFPLVVEQGAGQDMTTDTVWVEAEPSSERLLALHSLQARLAENQIALFEEIPNAIESPGELPTVFTLGNAYPNPFNPSVTIPFTLGKTAQVTVDLFDITGRRVATILDRKMVAGNHSINYQAPSTLAAGVYLLRAESSGHFQTQKLLLLK